LWRTPGFAGAERIGSDLLRANSNEWTGPRLAGVVEAVAALHRGHEDFAHFDRLPFKPLIGAVEKAAAREGISPELRGALERWQAALAPRALTPDERKRFAEAKRIFLRARDHENIEWETFSAASHTMDRLERIRTPLTEERKLSER